MARPEAIRKLLHYPTPERVMHDIVRDLDVGRSSWGSGTILDPCASIGTAVKILADAWRLTAYGVELHPERAATLAQTIQHGFCGSYRQIWTDIAAPFSVLFMNPPYDYDRLDDETVERQETQFLTHCTPMLIPGGLLIFIPPASLLRRQDFREYLSRHYHSVQCRRFPDGEFEAFRQVVIYGIRRHSPAYDPPDLTREFRLDTMPILGADGGADGGATTGSIWLQAGREFKFALLPFDPDAVAPEYTDTKATGVWGSRAWQILTGDGLPGGHNAPLISPRPGHQAMLLAAGALNGCAIGHALVKGGSDKKITEIKNSDGTIERETIESHLSVLDMRTGDLDTWNVQDDLDKTLKWFDQHQEALAHAIKTSHTPAFDGDLSAAQPVLDRLTPPGTLPGHDRPIWLDGQVHTAAAVAHRWREHKNVVISGQMGTGKGLPLLTPILTPTGWRPVGDLVVGDLVVDPDTGGTTEVTGVFPQDVKSVFRVTFSDGVSTVCDDDHLWEVQTPLRKWSGKPARVLELREIRRTLTHKNGNRQHYIPLTAAVKMPVQDLPVPPYTVGALLGDGSLSSSVILASHYEDLDILDRVERETAPFGVTMKRGGPEEPCRHRLAVGRGETNPLLNELRALGLMGRRAWEKVIPPPYMRGSVQQRLALLHGLFDTDGHPHKSGGLEYSTTSMEMARQVQQLVWSLGGTATIKVRTTHYTLRGERIPGRPSCRVFVKFPTDVSPFYLARKREVARPHQFTTGPQAPRRSIVSVEREGEQECVCIKVRNPRGLYLVNDYIVTHNTSVSVVATEIADQGRQGKTVVLCPSHLVKKWVREIRTIIGRPCAMAGKSLADVDRFFDDPAMRYLIVSKETAKLGLRWKPVWATRTKVRASVVPLDPGETPEPNTHKYQQVRENRWSDPVWMRRVLTRTPRATCPQCGTPVTEPGTRTKSRCPNATCGRHKSRRKRIAEALWQVQPLSAKGTTRWPLASWIAHRYARRYSLVLDEGHQYAGSQSDQSRAAARLLANARKTLVLTGTLYGGRASSLFYLLFWSEPSFRAIYPDLTEAKRFSEHHGLFERVFKDEESDSTYGYRKGNTGGRLREIPGMSPAMIPLLLPFTVFLKLRDLQLELPPYEEVVEVVDPDPEVARVAHQMAMKVKAVLRKYPQALGAYLQACLGYPDRADQAEHIEGVKYDQDGEEIERVVLATAPALPDATYPKDDRAVEIAIAERAAGRGVLIYTSQNKRRDARPRLRARLEAAGLRVVVLDAAVPPGKREEWLRKEVAKGFDVMITNGKLVETGLDLLWAHTIIQYGTEYSVNTLRQSFHRSWRIGQDKPIRVILLAYKGGMQEIAMKLIAQKMRAAELVDGDEVGGLGQTDEAGSNLLYDLAQRALSE